MIDIPRAFTYVFDDPQWVSKLVMVAIVTFGSAILTPVLIGLVGFAILFGYQLELIRNIRRGERYPLPAWDDFGRFLNMGINPVIAWVAYNVPNLVISLVIGLIGFTAGDGLLSGGLISLAFCCFVPLLILYNLAIQPVYTLGLGRYAEEPRLNVFFEFSSLIRLVRSRTDALIQWLLGAVIAAIVLGLVNAIPCLGWIVGGALTIPIFGHLSGQYITVVLGQGQMKRKNM
ncbi:MAG: DUF4013 domain-containing protein [Chloroflexi bacterium]|nr:DUF4013 domain-containing protein [Chloroflexota bacterium]